jgi:acyl dehydratase
MSDQKQPAKTPINAKRKRGSMNPDPPAGVKRDKLSAATQKDHSRRLVIETLGSLRELVDREFVAVDWVPVEQERIQAFAELTDDLQWIHVDVERARRESPYRSTVAHGFLTLALLSHFMDDAIEIKPKEHFAVNYGLNRVRFPAPVRAGDLIRARFQLRSLEEKPGGYRAIYAATVDLKGFSKPCCVADWIVDYSPLR